MGVPQTLTLYYSIFKKICNLSLMVLCYNITFFDGITLQMKTKNDLISKDNLVKNGCNFKSLGTIEEYCKKQGLRFTSIRKHILQLIWDSQCAVKAYDLLEEIKPNFNKAKPATVYRTLDFLLEQGFIHKVMSLNAFIACKQFHCNDNQILLFCTQCHKTEEKTGEEMIRNITYELKQSGFINQINSIEIQGLCVNCDPL